MAKKIGWRAIGLMPIRMNGQRTRMELGGAALRVILSGQWDKTP